MTGRRLQSSRILVVDDEPSNVALLERLLLRWGLTNVVSTTDPTQVVAMCAEEEPDLVLLDLHMPGADGFTVMSLLSPWILSAAPFPIVVLTADGSVDVKRRALECGARDFLTKPFDLEEVRLRVANLLETRRMQRDMQRHSEMLEAGIRARTGALDASRLEVVERLARAAEFRDDETGEHTRRVARTARLVAERLGLSQATVDMIGQAAPLHDVGKIGIPDDILLKAGRLSPAEFETMKQHVVVGSELLKGGSSELLQLAQRIAISHHERWDGTGYVSGLAGEDIPIEGRIVAIADVFDALTHARPYKQAWPIAQALEEIWSQSGRAFDPQVVEAFAALDHAALLEPAAAPANPVELPAHAPVNRAAAARFERTEDVAAAAPAEESPSALTARTVTLSEAAAALAVSGSTLRRWADSGRIQAHRTTGGHRRFAIDDIRRVMGDDARSRHAVRVIAPPAGPLLPLAELLSSRGEELHQQASRLVYPDRLPGWFSSEHGTTLASNWINALTSACLNAGYDDAISATASLMRHAFHANTTFLERYTYVERFWELVQRQLRDSGNADPADQAASWRLFGAIRQSLLQTAV
jgi:putative two-component system response regulator